MHQHFFDRPEVQDALWRLVSAKDEVQLWMAKQLFGDSILGSRIIVSLPRLTNKTDIPSRSISPLLLGSHIVSYFQHPYLYFIYHERLFPPLLRVDYTISFDTSYGNYVKKIVTTNSLNGLEKSVINTFDQILRKDMDFNLFFYFVENFKLVPSTLSQNKDKITPLSFWESLNSQFRNNIVALHTFKEVNCRHYIQTGELKFNIEPAQAYRKSIEFTYNFYLGEGKELANFFLELQRLLVLQMLGMFRIQYSSQKSAIHKLNEFMEFVQEKGVVIFERELVAVYKYFSNRNSVRLFKRVNMGGNQANIFEKTNNLAWDMMAARFLERTLVLEHGDFTIPLLASSDRALIQYFSLFPVKVTVFHRPSGNVISIPETPTEFYFNKEGCGDIIKKFLSPEFKEKRISEFNVGNEVISDRIKSELEDLLPVLTRNTTE